MAVSFELAECMQVWWVEVTFLVSFLLGWALLRGKWRLGGGTYPVARDSEEAIGENATKSDDVRHAPGGAKAMRELIGFLKQDVKALPEATREAPALDLFRQAQLYGCRIDEAACSQLLDAGARAELPLFVGEVAGLTRSRLQLNAALCRSLMRAYVAVGLVQEARGIYDEASAKCLELDDEVDDLYDEILANEALSSNS
mmetsp:Transcript_8412/g.22853  ORF Transcript_8412/g.22853 Transcript_8412/m.22853 type:complete len:200 (-) Transcript_8412:85-684(-)|eukprot:CAMPEP_0171185378 /NCGR_PEP_ID=MMETSP0790-20130122/16271_1 /TAXON_ID=2925 /ORGANISM="Alexandrium catenella, Strain OF101" /LENGTH=199 /DNA_ID=CAMNT_0011650399 /DNA_START=130 /DNA_END=729 /DNA_ORIENTATION=-